MKLLLFIFLIASQVFSNKEKSEIFFKDFLEQDRRRMPPIKVIKFFPYLNDFFKNEKGEIVSFTSLNQKEKDIIKDVLVILTNFLSDEDVEDLLTFAKKEGSKNLNVCFEAIDSLPYELNSRWIYSFSRNGFIFFEYLKFKGKLKNIEGVDVYIWNAFDNFTSASCQKGFNDVFNGIEKEELRSLMLILDNKEPNQEIWRVSCEHVKDNLLFKIAACIPEIFCFYLDCTNKKIEDFSPLLKNIFKERYGMHLCNFFSFFLEREEKIDEARYKTMQYIFASQLKRVRIEDNKLKLLIDNVSPLQNYEVEVNFPLAYKQIQFLKDVVKLFSQDQSNPFFRNPFFIKENNFNFWKLDSEHIEEEKGFLTFFKTFCPKDRGIYEYLKNLKDSKLKEFAEKIKESQKEKKREIKKHKKNINDFFKNGQTSGKIIEFSKLILKFLDENMDVEFQSNVPLSSQNVINYFLNQESETEKYKELYKVIKQKFKNNKKELFEKLQEFINFYCRLKNSKNRNESILSFVDFSERFFNFIQITEDFESTQCQRNEFLEYFQKLNSTKYLKSKCEEGEAYCFEILKCQKLETIFGYFNQAVKTNKVENNLIFLQNKKFISDEIVRFLSNYIFEKQSKLQISDPEIAEENKLQISDPEIAEGNKLQISDPEIAEGNKLQISDPEIAEGNKLQISDPEIAEGNKLQSTQKEDKYFQKFSFFQMKDILKNFAELYYPSQKEQRKVHLDGLINFCLGLINENVSPKINQQYIHNEKQFPIFLKNLRMSSQANIQDYKESGQYKDDLLVGHPYSRLITFFEGAITEGAHKQRCKAGLLGDMGKTLLELEGYAFDYAQYDPNILSMGTCDEVQGDKGYMFIKKDQN
ncbi:hypothetical protein P618_200158 [Holospora obtusa F1]|uniref:Uncharacterized protein n=1 Tax=Holospora obtusa F1 TaxID=1399147 RepID=W6TF81_HOLOB|nr:hypothetical protein [Holospora obtusa]ETZ07644.1 hypothetical protein P618_200158 [Holospora obtusa F1]